MIKNGKLQFQDSLTNFFSSYFGVNFSALAENSQIKKDIAALSQNQAHFHNKHIELNQKNLIKLFEGLFTLHCPEMLFSEPDSFLCQLHFNPTIASNKIGIKKETVIKTQCHHSLISSFSNDIYPIEISNFSIRRENEQLYLSLQFSATSKKPLNQIDIDDLYVFLQFNNIDSFMYFTDLFSLKIGSILFKGDIEEKLCLIKNFSLEFNPIYNGSIINNFINICNNLLYSCYLCIGNLSDFIKTTNEYFEIIIRFKLEKKDFFNFVKPEKFLLNCLPLYLNKEEIIDIENKSTLNKNQDFFIISANKAMSYFKIIASANKSELDNFDHFKKLAIVNMILNEPPFVSEQKFLSWLKDSLLLLCNRNIEICKLVYSIDSVSINKKFIRNVRGTYRSVSVIEFSFIIKDNTLKGLYVLRYILQFFLKYKLASFFAFRIHLCLAKAQILSSSPIISL